MIDPTHEISGIHTRGIWIFIALFIPSAALLLFVVWLLFGGLVHYLARSEPASLLIGQDTPTLAQPLQPSPGHPTLDWQDLTALNSAQISTLTTYGKLPNDPTHAHIPITRAMQLLLQNRSLNAPPTASATQPYLNTTQPTPTENRT